MKMLKFKELIIVNLILFFALFCFPVFPEEKLKDKPYQSIISKFQGSPDKDWQMIFEENEKNITPLLIEELLFWIFDRRGEEDQSPQITQKTIELIIFLSNKTGYLKGEAKGLIYKDWLIDYMNKTGDFSASSRKALELFNKIQDKEGQGYSYLSSGSISENKEKYNEAIDQYGRAFAIFNEIKNDKGIINSYLHLGGLYQEMGKKDIALNYYKKGRKTAYEKNLINAAVCLNFKLAMHYRNSGRDREALECLNENLILLGATSDDELKALLANRNNYFFNTVDKLDYFNRKQIAVSSIYKKAGCYRGLGKYQEAMRLYHEGAELAKANNFLMDLNFFYLSMAHLYSRLGKKDLAVEYFEKSLAVKSDKFPLVNSVMSNFSFADYLAGDMEDYKKALFFIENGIKAAGEIKIQALKESYTSLGFLEKGGVYIKLKDYKAAQRFLARALENFNKIYKDFGFMKEGIISTLAAFGELYREKGDYNKALEYHQKALNMSDNFEELKASLNEKIALDFEKAGNYEKAISYLEKTVSSSSTVQAVKNLWDSFLKLGEVYEKTNNIKTALENYKKSEALIDEASHDITIEDYKTASLGKKTKVYEKIISLLSRSGEFKEAFYYSEKSRARAFLDSIANQRVDYLKDADPFLIEQEKNIRARIQFLSNREEKDSSGNLVIKKEELAKLKREYAKLLDEIKLRCPQYAGIISVSPVSIEDAQKMLDSDEVFLEYFVGDENSYLWAVSDNFVKFYTLEIKKKELKEIIENLRKKISTPDEDEGWENSASRLYEILVKPAWKDIEGKKNIIIIPHQDLHYIPFQLFCVDKNTFLIDKFNISYLPSISAYKFLPEQNYKATDSKAYEFAGFALGETIRKGYPALPGTKEEVLSISKLFKTQKLFIESDMTADNFKEYAGSCRMLHIATHTSLDPSAPLFTSLLFSDDELMVSDIFNIPINAELVVLSACETSLGRHSSGDDLVCLTRSFMYAGATSVIASLWKVSDKSTQLLMTEFYNFLLKLYCNKYLKTSSRAAAIREAQLQVRNKYPHPFYWAPFILTGQWK